jgi:hypothetical protein
VKTQKIKRGVEKNKRLRENQIVSKERIMNCKNCNEENDLDCISFCWKCGEKLDVKESKPSCSKWIVSQVISLPFDTKKEAESFIETMKKGFIYKDSNLIVTEMRTAHDL